MRKIFITILTGLFLFLNNSQAQLTVTMSTLEVDPNAQASVDVTVNGFTNLLGVQFSMNFDSLVLEYVNTTNFGSLQGLNASTVSGPNGVGVKNGQITFSWFDGEGTGKTLPAGTRLFTIVFKAIGAKCSKSDIVTSNVPRVIEIVNASFMNVTLINNKGTVTVKCDGNPVDTCQSPACSNPNNLAFIAPTITAAKDQTVCIPISVRNFKSLQSGQGSIRWNPALLQFTEVKTPATGGIPGFSGGFNTNNAPTGEFKYLWFNDNPAIPLTLPDNTVIMELCFKVIGNTGQIGCIQIGQGSLATEWENDNGAVPVCFTYGKVNIGGNPPTGVLLKTSSGEGAKGSVVCLDVTVENFIDIFGFNTKYMWDPTQLRFLRTEMYDLEGLNSSAFSSTTNMLSMLWTNPDGITRPNGHRIFKICFELLNPCDGTSNVTVPGPTEFIGKVGGVPAAVPGTATGGSIKITCGGEPICTLGAIVQPDCNGGTNGSVAMTVTNATADCVCQWKNAAGTIVKTGLASAGCNLTGVGAGTYTFELFCSGVSKCTNTAVINQPPGIVIPSLNVVTNVICNDKGAIDIRATSGGNGGFSYAWTPAQGNTANPVNLNAGVYSVVVTDAKGCTATASFTVGNTPSSITIPTNNVVTNVGCGQKGAIDIRSTSGGNGTLNYAWTPNLGNTANPTNLDPGTYVVTVTDSKGCTATAQFVVSDSQPPFSVTSTVTNVKCKGGSDGAIQLNLSGGCAPYSFAWASGPNTQNLQNLRAGTYTVTVTDSETPIQTRVLTMTITEPAEALTIALTGSVDASTASASDGSLTINITGGTSGYKTVWSGPTTIPDGNTTGTLEAKTLRAGLYNVTVTDANGCTAVRTGMEVKIRSAVIAPKFSSASVSSNFNTFGVSCFGAADGAVVATLSEGTYPVTVNLKSGAQTLRSITVSSAAISFTGLAAGSYVIEATNSAGTIVSNTLIVTQPTRLAATIKVECTEKNQESGAVELNLNNTGSRSYTYNWFGLSATGNRAEGLAKGAYNVTVTDSNGCELKLTNIEVKECVSGGGECFKGNDIITPNGDTFNDFFVINCLGTDPGDLTVFDRWGRVVYSQSNYDNTWQGVDNAGKDLKEGGYIWVLTINFGQGRKEVHKGTVTILRG